MGRNYTLDAGAGVMNRLCLDSLVHLRCSLFALPEKEKHLSKQDWMSLHAPQQTGTLDSGAGHRVALTGIL